MSTPGTPGTTPAERAAMIERILKPGWPVLADAGSPPEDVARARDVLRRVTDLIDGLHGIGQPETRRSPEPVQPHVARARARKDPRAEIGDLQRAAEREAAGLHRLRKDRRQCEASTRAGGRCQAPAIPGGSVCRRHGGGAPQVRVQAALTLLYESRYEAAQAFEAARGGPSEYDALCELSQADNAVKRAEAKVGQIRELRAELRRRKATTADPTDPLGI
jgi:hypothetical protein